MATSSITKNFVISGKEQVEMFVNAIEESAKNRPVCPVVGRPLPFSLRPFLGGIKVLFNKAAA